MEAAAFASLLRFVVSSDSSPPLAACRAPQTLLSPLATQDVRVQFIHMRRALRHFQYICSRVVQNDRAKFFAAIAASVEDARIM